MALNTRKAYVLTFAVVIGVGLLLAAAVSVSRQPITPSTGTTPSAADISTSTVSSSTERVERPQSVSFGTTCIDVELAVTDDQKRQGLSDRPSLADGRGMLFIYKEAGDRHFWMRRMNFSIDIIWLDEGRQVVDVHHDLAPESYPERFSPEEPAQYVLEVPAGTANEKSIKQGSRAIFSPSQCVDG